VVFVLVLLICFFPILKSHLLQPATIYGAEEPWLEFGDAGRDYSAGGYNWTSDITDTGYYSTSEGTYSHGKIVVYYRDIFISVYYFEGDERIELAERSCILSNCSGVVVHDLDEDGKLSTQDYIYIRGEPYGNARVGAKLDIILDASLSANGGEVLATIDLP
ncbi:MAG: hypothetical protein KAT70_00250, partial [Thermoplasmata archaeon]|nr:hypothetical protein [Thermoplasmata archaeon]